MIGRHGTRVNSWDFSTTANLPLDRCTGSGKLAADALAVRGGAERQALTQSHLRSDAGYLALPQDGEKVAPVEDAAVPAAGGVALFDMVLAALVHGFADLLPEAGWRKVGRLAVDQPPVQPGRAVRSDLFCSDRPGKGRERWPDCLGRRHGRRHG